MTVPKYFFGAPLIVFLVAYLGSYITEANMSWYRTLTLPPNTPPGVFIGFVWSTIFLLVTLSIILFWMRAPRGKRFVQVNMLFAVNAILNVGWTAVFFGMHSVNGAVWAAGILALSVLSLIIAIFPISRLSALLLVPYFGWVVFATTLAYRIAVLNS